MLRALTNSCSAASKAPCKTADFILGCCFTWHWQSLVTVEVCATSGEPTLGSGTMISLCVAVVAAPGLWLRRHNRGNNCRFSWIDSMSLIIFCSVVKVLLGTANFEGQWKTPEVLATRGLMRGLATLPQNNQEPLMVKDKVGRAPGELEWASTWNVTLFPISALTVLLGQKERQPAHKMLGVGLLVVTMRLDLCTSYGSRCHHYFHCLYSNKIQNGDIPGKWPLNKCHVMSKSPLWSISKEKY